MSHAAPHAASFDELFNAELQAHPTGEPVRMAHWWSSWESWATFALILIAQFPMISSLQSADWVEEMPSLFLVGLVAFAVGWLLAQSRLHASIAVILGLVAGAAVVVLLLLWRVPLVDPSLGTGWIGHWREFSLRMQAWFSALWQQSISTDPLPFVVLLAALVYVVVFLSCWAVVRWQNAWAALIPGGIILLTNISYLPGQPSLEFIIFLLGAVLLVTRMEFLSAGARWRRDHVVVPAFMSLEVMWIGSMVAFILVIAAWIVPTANNWGPVARAWDRALEPVATRVERFGRLFVGINSKREVPVHTFGPALPLQGKVVLGATPLLRVTSTEPGNLRGAVYDEYTGAGWKLTAAAAVPLSGTTVQAAEQGTQRTKSEVRHPVTTQVEVLAGGVPDRRLLSVGDPLTATVPGRRLIDPNAQPLGVIPNSPASPGKSYTTVGSVSSAALPTLLAAGTAYPQEIIDTYTALPAAVPPEVADLAQRVAGNAHTPYEAARRIETHLRNNYRFSLDPPPAAPRRDAVAAFLFDQRAGYFDQFASSMAVMLRSLGVPARVATGFVLDPADVDNATKAYTVTEQRAWTWAEVYFPNLGWVEFNPTPTRPRILLPGDDASALAEAEAARVSDAGGEEILPDDAGGTTVDLAGSEGQLFLETAAGRILVRAISTLLVLSLLLIAAAIVARVFWERACRGLRPAAVRWAKVHRLASWAGIAPAPHLTVVEAAEALGVALAELASMRAIARAYTRDRYGPPVAAPQPEDEQTERLADRDYRRVRDELRQRILSRIVHFGHVPEETLPGGYPAARAAGR